MQQKNKLPLDHFTHLRNISNSINTFALGNDYTITLIKGEKIIISFLRIENFIQGNSVRFFLFGLVVIKRKLFQCIFAVSL